MIAYHKNKPNDHSRQKKDLSLWEKVLAKKPPALLVVRIDGYSSEANTKVYWDGSAIRKILFSSGMSKASDNTRAIMKKQIWQIHSVMLGP